VNELRDLQTLKRASRRAFLGGGAVAVGLPFLESLLPRAARAQATPLPQRLIYYFVPNGIHMDGYRPTTTGENYVLTPILEPLAALKADFSVVSGLENVNANPDGPGDHASGTSAFITCAHANKSETEIELGISIDQVAANAIGQSTRLPSLQLGIDGGGSAGGCDSGYSCAYARNVSWTGPKTPAPKITDPSQAFDEIFRGFDPVASQAEIEKRRFYESSVLDLVSADADRLALRLSATDAQKLGEYTTSVRELERRMQQDQALACEPGARPMSDYEFPAHVDVMTELMVLALRCDATRIITFMLGNAVSGRAYPFLGIERSHHDISHHQDEQQNLTELQAINTWQMERFAKLLAGMKAVTEGTDDASNLLFNSSVFLSSDISDGDRHNHDDMPVLLAGHAGGVFTPGRHIAYPEAQRERVANLLVTTAHAAGVTATLGDSTGVLEDL
jgi:hypothetical protein